MARQSAFTGLRMRREDRVSGARNRRIGRDFLNATVVRSSWKARASLPGQCAQGSAMDELRPTAIDNAGKRVSAAGSAGADHKAAAKQGEAQALETAPVSREVLGQPWNAAGEVLN